MSRDIIACAIELRPALIASILIAVIFFIAESIHIRTLRISGRSMKSAGLYVGLSGTSLIYASFCFAKLFLLSGILLTGRIAKRPHIILFLALVAVTVLLNIRFIAVITEIVGNVLLVAGMWVCNTLLNYTMQIKKDPAIVGAYWLLSIILIMIGIILLLREIPEISAKRKYFSEHGYTE